MQTFESNFKRKEVKYRLTADQYVRIRAALTGYMVPDKYGASAIISTYLDTPERYLIIQSQEKPLYKEKLRIRRYGDALDATTPTFVEIKKKYKGIVYKRRICMSAAAAQAFLRGMPYERAVRLYPLADPKAQAETTSPVSLQIAREIFAFCRRYGRLDPSMDIRVIRTAWKLTAEGAEQTPFDVRVTFDENMRALDRFDDRALWTDLTAPGEVLMEIKCEGAYPRWLVDILNAVDARPSSFSKYGKAFELLHKGGTQCSIA